MDLRKTLRSVSNTAQWARQNPGAVKEIAIGLVRPAAASTPSSAGSDPGAGERELPAALADYDRTVTAHADASASAAELRALVGDLALIPDWMTIHAGWRGAVPPAPAPGLDFTEQIKIMGVPAEISWTVVEATPNRVGMTGTGPMGLRMALWFTVADQPAGASIWVDAGMGGEPLRGPLGGTIARTVHEEMERSLANLVALHEQGVQGQGGDGVAPVLHHASGRRLDPRTPVIVGVGQVVQHQPSLTNHPAKLAAEALRKAAADSGARTLLNQADAVYAVSSASWTYRDQGAAVAAELNISPAETVQSAPYGGDAGQLLINAAGSAIADGEAAVVLVCGAEAGNSFASAQKDGVTPDWPEQPPGTAPTRRLGSDREANNDAEGAAGLMAPIYVYAFLENALRHKLGRTRDEHQREVAELWSQMSQVAAQNPYAWQPEEHTSEQLRAIGDENRMISSPYSKLLCANMQVDLASGIIVTSVAAAEAAGVPQEKWVFLHAGAAAHDEWFVSERGDLAASPAIHALGKAALDHAGVTIDDVAQVDLYSCFPVAVQIAAAELGLPVNDPDRPLSLTGGLTFGGGPGNNYGGHGVAQLVERLRANPDQFGISTSLGWYVTKHALGLYSAQPPSTPYRSLNPVLEPGPTRPVLKEWVGEAVVESFTVPYDRDGSPTAPIVSLINDAGERILRRFESDDATALFTDDDPLGWRVEIDSSGELTVLERGQADLPAPPSMPVLVDRSGPLWVITLNRPERRNAIDLPTATLLERVIDAFEADDTARVAILTGAGETFSAGMDLKAAATGQFPITDRRGPLGITGAPISKPMIAAVEGHALAGGCELALVCDLIVASTDSQFGLPEAKRGLVAAAGGVLRLAQRLPRNVAMELVLTGNPMPAGRMAQLGLVNRLAEPGTVLKAAIALAEELMLNAPISLQVSKQIIDSSPDWSTDEEFAKQSELAGTALFSDDAAEGVAAFAEGREPVWRGR